MNGFCAFVFDRAAVHPSFCFNESSDNLEVSEIYASPASYQLQILQVPGVDVEAWLTREAPYESPMPALLRLVWIPLHKEVRPWQLDTQKCSLDTFVKNFQVEEAYKYSFTSPACFAVIPACRRGGSDTRTFSLCIPDLFAVAWRNDTRSGKTEGVCWAPGWITETMQDLMSLQKEWARNPLFLALVASVMLAYLLDRDLTREAMSIAAVENRTKYHGFKDTFVGIAKGDYASLSQRISGCAVLLAGLERICKVLNEFLSDISSHAQRYGIKDNPRSGTISMEVDECIETLKRRLKMQKIQIDYLSRRVEVQLTAVLSTASIPRFRTFDSSHKVFC